MAYQEIHFANEIVSFAKIILDNPTLAIGFLCFTLKQKNWIRERDNQTCVAHQLRIPHDCNASPTMPIAQRKTEIHHLKPQRYLKEFGINPDYEQNGCTLCQNFHRHHIHPDMGRAIRNYHKNRGGIAQVQKDRDQLMKQRVVYWVDIHDRALSTKVVQNSQRMAKRDPNNVFPER